MNTLLTILMFVFMIDISLLVLAGSIITFLDTIQFMRERIKEKRK